MYMCNKTESNDEQRTNHFAKAHVIIIRFRINLALSHFHIYTYINLYIYIYIYMYTQVFYGTQYRTVRSTVR